MICPNNTASVIYCNCKEGDCAMNDFKNKTKYGYRKKPLVIQACQYNGHESIDELKSWVESSGKSWEHNFLYVNDSRDLFIQTLEGQMHASVGDYIIKGVQDEFYACKPNVFHQTYERA